jgi:hypothetical protein
VTWFCNRIFIVFAHNLASFSIGADIIEDLYSPRTAAMDFVNELVRKRGKGILQKFIQFIVGIFMRYGLVLTAYTVCICNL